MNLLTKSLSCVAAVSAVTAMAQDKPATTMVTPYGLVQSYVNLSDSGRSSTPDFNTKYVRIGLKVAHDMLRGQIETAFLGDAKMLDTNGATPVVYDSGMVAIRMANLGMDFSTGTSLRFGRVRPGEVIAWGLDATSVPDGYAAIDGMMVSHNIALGGENSIGLGLTYGNAMSIDPDLSANAGRQMYANSDKAEKASVVSVKVSHSNVKAEVMYGMEKNFVIKRSLDTKVGAGASVAENATHMEASLGYQLPNIGAGVWMQQIVLGAQKPVTANEGGKLTLGDQTADKTTYSILGLGVTGDSTLFGVNDVWMKDGRYTYGAAYAMRSTRTAGLEGDAKTAQEDADEKELTLGGGWAAGAFSLTLNVKQVSAKAKQYENSKGVKEATSRTSTALVAAYAF